MRKQVRVQAKNYNNISQTQCFSKLVFILYEWLDEYYVIVQSPGTVLWRHWRMIQIIYRGWSVELLRAGRVPDTVTPHTRAAASVS